jgi:L-lactate utilization protein LutC
MGDPLSTPVTSAHVRAGLLAAFEATVLVASSDHRQVAGWVEIVDELSADARERDDRRVALSPTLLVAEPTLPEKLRRAGLEAVVPDDRDPAAAVADVPVGIVRGELGIAETGSVLVSEHALADRVVTMLCHRLFQVVRAEDIVARLDDLAAWLSAHRDSASFVSLMTGPSRTADIERSLTIGVQGPQEVSVRVLTGDRSGDPTGTTTGDRR